MKVLRRTVLKDDYLDDEESLLAYSYDASGAEGKPTVVVKPRHAEQLRRILVLANQYRLSIVPRGSGTGVRAGAVCKEGVIVDMRGFDSISNYDKQRKTIDVGTGVTYRKLSDALAKLGMRFPLEPLNENATIGGLAAVNHITEESFKYGDWHELVEQVECFDGLGRFNILKGEDVSKVVGWEGATGVLVKLRLKLVKEFSPTVDTIQVDGFGEAMAEATKAMVKKPLAIEYLDPLSAEACGLSQEEHLLVAYDDDKGSYKREAAEKMWRARKKLNQRLWNDGFVYEVEATLEEDRLQAFAKKCHAAHLPCYGHLGMGILMTGVKTRREAERFRNNVVALGGTPGGKQGYGRAAKAYAPTDVKKQLLRLKEERDYNHVLNPGVIA